MLANFSDEPLTTNKATVLGVAEGIAESIIDKVNEGEPGSDSPTKPRRNRKNKALYCKLLRGKLDHLLPDERRLIEPVLVKYAHVFHDEGANDFKGTDLTEHDILVGDTPPIRRPQYRVPYALRDEMKIQVEKMLTQGNIRENNSPWAERAILVPEKTPDGKTKCRFCVDFRALNAVTKFASYPLPVFEETTSTLHGSR
jgi:hypothetical protein